MSNDRDDEFDPQPGDDTGRGGPSVWLVLFLVLAAVTAIFIVQNGDPVPTEFLWLDGEFRFWVTIIASVGLGIVLDRLILTWWRRARRKD